MNRYVMKPVKRKKDTDQCPIEYSTLERDAERVLEVCGLACHSSYQSEYPIPNDKQCRICSQAVRDKVLDEVQYKLKQKIQSAPSLHTLILDMKDVDSVFIELRQAGE